MDLPRLHGIIPPLPTPLRSDETIDAEALEHLVDFQIKAGVHGVWILGTTARFDLIPDARQRQVAELAATAAAGRVPMVLNVSDQGTERTLTHARMFDDLPYDYYAALSPWYQVMTPAEVADYFLTLADRLARPLVIYNAPWVCNQLSFSQLRQLGEHPRIVGCKDVGPSLSRALDWPSTERRRLGFSYLHGTDLLANSADLDADGFVCSLSNPYPELAVAIWEATRAGDFGRAFQLQSRFSRLGRATEFGPMHACLEVMCRHRGLLERMLPSPLRPLEAEIARRVVEVVEEVGLLPGDLEEAVERPSAIRGTVLANH
jgi:4-hydroxy-tetrahydrodipicolinate synthase